MSHIHFERPHHLNKARLRRQVEELADKLEFTISDYLDNHLS